jgi:hypothetical protein
MGKKLTWGLGLFDGRLGCCDFAAGSNSSEAGVSVSPTIDLAQIKIESRSKDESISRRSAFVPSLATVPRKITTPKTTHHDLLCIMKP